MSDLRGTDENGAPCEPRFFARAAWLAAIPLAWACSLAIILGVQGLSGAVHEARGPAHYHAHDGSHDHGHDHASVERHHHGPDAQAILIDEVAHGSELAMLPAKSGGFDVLPFAFVPPFLPDARRGACVTPFLVPSPEPFFSCERPPASPA